MSNVWSINWATLNLLNPSSSRNCTRTEHGHSSSWLCLPSTERPSSSSRSPLWPKNSTHPLLSTITNCEWLPKGSEINTRIFKPSSYSIHNQFSIPCWITQKPLVSLIVRAGVRPIKLECPRKRPRSHLVLITCELNSSLDSLSGCDFDVYLQKSAGWTHYTLYLQSISKPPFFLLFQILNLCSPPSFLALSISTTLST